MQMTAANILTLTRLILTPVFVYCFLRGLWPASLIVYSVAAFTDLIDGTVARILKQPSKGGALLDPLADKLLNQSCFVCLLSVAILPLWFFAMALVRDVMIIGGIIYLEKKGAKLPYRPVWSSKLATLLQLAVAVMGLVLWHYSQAPLAGAGLTEWFVATLVVTAVLIIVSGVQYVIIGLGILRNHR